ncbi:MBL fold metallo-hydrolase [Sinomonas sp. G460-2]|uniref:MBL fold metallo-hydrolase n=1 Tax=Sinomonas sp. G460-2 TaxID=3393464 RepID=UPI0039EE0143
MSVEITGTAQRQAWADKVFPPVERLDRGLWSIPIAFPGNPMRYTLCYALISDEDCLVIDPGFDTRQGFEQLAAGLAAAGVTPTEVTSILATHFHTDHLGMARRLADVSGAPIGLGAAEQRYISDYRDAEGEVALDRARMCLWGVPADRVAEGAMTVDALEHLRRLPDADYRVGAGDDVPFGGSTVRTIETPGHTPGHICLELLERLMLISGDHLLPRISPNVSLEMRGDPDPLGSYIRSLQFIELNDHYEVLPAHEYRFRAPATRARQLLAGIDERSAQIVEAVSGEAEPTVFNVARKIYWSRGFESLQGLQFRLALSETAAHLQHLRAKGLVQGVEGLPALAPLGSRASAPG